MAVSTQTDLIIALERGQFDLVIETQEANWIDFKEAPYQIEHRRQKWELAKDVAAIANSQGGIIVMGYRTKRPENALVDIAIEHRPIKKNQINWDSYRQTISSWIYPQIEGVSSFWFPADLTAPYGVFALVVPPQAETSKYFVVRELNRPDGTFPGAIGIPIRQGDVITWLRPEAVHNLLQEAISTRRARLARINHFDQSQVEQTEQQRVELRCTKIESIANWADSPFIALHAIPSRPTPRPEDFYANEGMKRKIEHPGVLREKGFHVRTQAPIEIQKDGSIVTVNSRRVIWLSPNGFLSVAAVAGSEFLGWYFNQGNQRPIAINPRVLTEYTLEFSRLFHNSVRQLHPDRWNLWVSIVGFDRNGGVVLVPAIGGGGDEALFWRGNIWENRGPLKPTIHRFQEATQSASSDAYLLLVEFYAAFGFPPDEIPFVDNRSISKELLLAALGR